MSEQKSYKIQIIVALIGAIAIIIGATIGITPNLMDSSAEMINPKINKNENSSTTSVVKMPLIPEGTYRQTSVKPIALGECPECEITIKYKNKDTIEITSNNDWFGYARYDKNSGSYKGTSEYLKGRGGDYKDTKSNIVVFYDNNVITIDSSNEKVAELIQVTYRMK